MALPVTGMQARLLLSQFRREVNFYQRAMKSIEKSTGQAASSVEKDGQRIAKGISQSFDKLAAMDPKERFAALGQILKGGAQEATGMAAAVGGLAGSLSAVVPIAIGLATVVGAIIKVAQESVQTFQELGQETYKLHLQMGGMVSQVSAFAAAAKIAGAEGRPMATGLAQLSKRVADYELRAAAGSKHTTEFQRAVEAMGISVRNADGTLKGSQQLLYEISDAFEQLGPGVFTTEAAMNLFGRSGREMLPILFQGAEGMRELEDEARRLGVVMGKDDVQASVDLATAQNKLNLAMEGLKVTAGRELVPVLTKIAETTVKVVNTFRRLVSLIGGVQQGIITLVTTMGDFEAAMEAGKLKALELAGVQTPMQRWQEESEAALDALNQNIAMAVNEQSKLQDRLIELNEQRIERIEDAERQFSRRWEDILIQRGRALEDAARRTAQRIEDIWRAYHRRVEDILADYNKRRDDIEERYAKRRRKLRDRLHDQLEKLLRRHLFRMESIRLRFIDQASEAARRRDAIAFLRAVRERDRAFRDEKRAYEMRRQEIIDQYQKQKKEIDDALKDALKAEEDRLQEALEQARKMRDRQLEDLAIALQRQEEERQISYERQREDFERAWNRRMDDIERWYQKERADLDAQLRVIEQRLITWQREKEQLEAEMWRVEERQRQEAFQAAQTQHANFYSTLLQQATDFVQEHKDIMSVLAWPLLPLTMPLDALATFLEDRLNIDIPIFGRAQGGTDIVRKPTLFMAGERGPEMHTWTPLGGAGVRHTLGGSFGVNVTGLGGTGQAEMAAIARAVGQQLLLEYVRGVQRR